MSRFQLLATVRAAHAYFGGPCREFDFILPAETQATARRGRILARLQAGALMLFCEMDDAGTAPRIKLEGDVLRVGLRPSSPYISNITDPAALMPGGVALWRNHTVATQLDAPELIAFTPTVFSHPLAEVARPVTVTATNDRGQTLRSDVITLAQARTAVSYDFTGVDPGAITITESYPSAVTRTRRYLLHPELAGERLAAVVELKLRAALYAAATPPTFEASFAARAETLRYYLVVTNHTDVEFAKLTVVDLGSTEEKRPKVDFTRVNAPFGPGELSTDLLGATDPAARYLLFRSNAPVTRQERARKKLQLRRDSEVLIENLPQPRAGQSDANLVIHVAKAK